MKPLTKELFAALEELERTCSMDHPDETVQWALNDLSEDGHAYLLGPKNRVLEEFKRWKEL